MFAAIAAGSLLLAGCKGLEALGQPPRPTADVGILDRAIAAEQQLVGTYHAALSALAGQARATGIASQVLAEHQAHLVRLRSRLILPPGLTPATPRHRLGPPTLPTEATRLLAVLVSAENAAATRLLEQLRTAPPALAQLMASIGASEAGHAALLIRSGLA